MELQQINQRIAVVNAESKRLNNERQMLIGKRQTLEKQLNDLLQAYKNQYGVELTIASIDSELQRVATLKEKEVSSIETMLTLIKEGRYDEAEQLAAGEAVGETVQTPVQEQQPVVEPTPVSAPAPVTPPTPVAPPTFTKPVETPVAPPPVTPASMMASIPTTPVQPTQPTQPVQPAAQMPTAPVAPPPVQVAAPPADMPAPPPPLPNKEPKLGAPPAMPSNGVASFQAILSGSAFNPQEG